MYLAIFIVKNLCHEFSNFCRVFSKTLFSSFKNCVVYLAIFVVYLVKPVFFPYICSYIHIRSSEFDPYFDNLLINQLNETGGEI